MYTRLESGKGEMGVFIQGNNEVTPWRFKIRAANSNNLQILPHILKVQNPYYAQSLAQ